ncbi:hypothetical protein PM10SUCC1_23780 [Propionigenium maris DSM 9537]|uniref:Uncharacterized protein n=1 Tax=Propionigenium maris DSM 9537 TaxID=1123000 RepID=A0A9W6GN44_9FUSO|nr:hypothetical protein [Propionigenium maris]GLI56864.1 hypothetical protein PM10SUCC1_23780 [Propionigenium maris DSM 9537]
MRKGGGVIPFNKSCKKEKELLNEFNSSSSSSQKEIIERLL